MNIQQMQADLVRVEQEKHDNKEFKEIYAYVKKREKRKYKERIDKLVKQVHDANKMAKIAKAKPRQRTVKLQTRNPLAYINRG